MAGKASTKTEARRQITYWQGRITLCRQMAERRREEAAQAAEEGRQAAAEWSTQKAAEWEQAATKAEAKLAGWRQALATASADKATAAINRAERLAGQLAKALALLPPSEAGRILDLARVGAAEVAYRS
jgi:hypothetical protein